MARRRNTIAQYVSFDMTAMATHIQGMNDAQLGAWCRKMVIDCCSGCLDPNTDPFVRSYYNRSQSKMIERQKINANNYNLRTDRRNAEIYGQETAEDTTPDKEGDSKACNTATEASETSGPKTDTSVAESAVRTSEADKALADGDFREGSRDLSDGSDAATMGSGRSAKTLDTDTRTGGDSLRGCDSKPASHSGKSPVRNKLSLLPPPEKKAYGTCKNVLLTDADGHHLREVYGPDLPTAIEILDSALENNPKLKKKYRNHAAVLRYGNWVWQEVQKIKERKVRLETAEINKKNAQQRAANGDGRTFKQKDSDDRNEWLRTSMFTNEAANG